MVVYIFLFLFSILLPLPVWGAGAVIINEIAWMGSLPKIGETATQAANNEWLELKNTTAAQIDLSGWKLLAEDGTPDIALSGVIAASGFFLSERTSDDTVSGIQADQIYVGALSNSGEILILKNSSGNEVDRVDGSNGWKINGASEIVGNNETKETAQRAASGWISASSTPRAENSASATSLSPETASSAQTQSQVIRQTVSPATSTLIPSIKVYAGEDKTVAAGSLTEFIGEAISAKNEPLLNSRFWWNFGDGASKEGRMVSHIFQVPGTYTVGLHVSSGSDARSDYLSITVVPNQVKVKNVLMGEGGYVTIFNPADVDIDIGEWILEDGAGRKFFLPTRTKIGPQAEIALANRVTGLFKDGASKVTLRYPNSFLVIEWREEAVVTSSPVVQAESPGPKETTKEISKAVLLPKESSLTATAAVATIPADLAQISSPSFNFSSKIFFFSALAISFITASLYLIIKTIH